MQGLPDFKISELNQQCSQNPELKILDYLPCPCKIPIKNCFWAYKYHILPNKSPCPNKPHTYTYTFPRTVKKLKKKWNFINVK